MNNESKSIKVLTGHTSPETAYLVDDYPYGFTLRCQIRYWLEFKKGHGYRLMSQTTNPKQGNVWNKPKGSTYCPGPSVMYLDEKNHVQWDGLHIYSAGPEQIAAFRARFPGVLVDEVAKVEVVSRKGSPNMWAEWDAKQPAPELVAHQAKEQATGCFINYTGPLTAITPASLALFLAFAKDAGNWSGTPLVGGNVGGSKEDRGNLTDLKKHGLITTFQDEGLTWVQFTASGKALAASHGIVIHN